MAYFARKLRYGAHDGEAGASYMALIELAKKKGGMPVGFVLYLRIIQYNYPAESVVKMIRLTVESAEEAIRRFWPWGKERAGREFPGFDSERWEKTTLWLDHVAAGGGYERYWYNYDYRTDKVRRGDWVRVGTPVRWASRRKKKPLQFGNLAHLVLIQQARINALREEKMYVAWEVNDLEEYDEETDSHYIPDENQEAYDTILAQMSAFDEKISDAEEAIQIFKAEMRFKVRQMFPNPINKTPRRVLRAQEKERQCT